MTTTTPPHPAKFSPSILAKVKSIVAEEARFHEGLYRVFDPFAGVGGIHELESINPTVRTLGFELEKEWADAHPFTLHANALHISKYWPEGNVFDAIVTSPCYGNRMADHHDARDDSIRNTYRHKLGRPLSLDSSAGLQWGDEYRSFHADVWYQCVDVLRSNGIFVLNCKDHIRKSEIQHVTDWHIQTLESLGLIIERSHWIDAPGNRMGQNGEKRIDHETITVLRKTA